MTEPTKVRFDAIYIVSAGSEALTLSTGTPGQLSGPSQGITANYGSTPSPGWNGWNVAGGLLASQNVVISNSSFLSVPGPWRTDLSSDYQQLGQTLAELSQKANDDWKIDEPVYNVARYVAAELMMNSYPAPKILVHGPKSVVFLWSEGTSNLYLTVSANQISALVSTPEEIKLRLDFPESTLSSASILFPALQSAQLGRPVVFQKSAFDVVPESPE